MLWNLSKKMILKLFKHLLFKQIVFFIVCFHISYITYETHRRMIDIQIPLSAPETYGYLSLGKLPLSEYNETKDVSKYPGFVGGSYITCQPGQFAIFFPQDGHQPCIGEGEIHKAIFKVKA